MGLYYITLRITFFMEKEKICKEIFEAVLFPFNRGAISTISKGHFHLNLWRNGYEEIWFVYFLLSVVGKVL